MAQILHSDRRLETPEPPEPLHRARHSQSCAWVSPCHEGDTRAREGGPHEGRATASYAPSLRLVPTLLSLHANRAACSWAHSANDRGFRPVTRSTVSVTVAPRPSRTAVNDSPSAVATWGGTPLLTSPCTAASAGTSTVRSGLASAFAKISTCCGIVRRVAPVTSKNVWINCGVVSAWTTTAAMSSGSTGAVTPSPTALYTVPSD